MHAATSISEKERSAETGHNLDQASSQPEPKYRLRLIFGNRRKGIILPCRFFRNRARRRVNPTFLYLRRFHWLEL